jgi:tetratricopeptide (TPR) repeat protein
MQQPRCFPLASFLICILIFSLRAFAALDPGPDKTVAPSGSIVIVRPPSLFGSAKANLSFDDKVKKYTTGPLTFSAQVRAGAYDIYSVNAAKPLATISVTAGATLYLVKNNDEIGLQLLVAIRGHTWSSGELTKIIRNNPSKDRSPDSSEWAEIMIVSPPAVFGDRADLAVGDRRKKEEVSKRTLTAQILPGVYEVFDSLSEKPVASITVASGEFLYAVASSHAGAQRQLGDLFFDNGNRKGACALYKAALALDSNMTDIYKRYAALALELQDPREATAALLRLYRSGQADGQDCQALAGLLASANRNEEAQQLYNKALAMANQAPSVFAGLGAVKLKTGDLAGAAAAYENAIRLRPDSTVLYLPAGNVYLKQKDTAKAIASYDRYFSKGVKNPAIAFVNGRLRFLRGEYKEARDMFLRLKGKAREKPEYAMMLGESYYRLKEYEKAAPLLAQAATTTLRSPRDPAIVEMLLTSLAQTGATVKMRHWIDKYSKSQRRNPATVAYFFGLLKEKKSSKDALALYQQCIKKYPQDYRSYLRSGILLSADAKSLQRALELLKKAAELADTVPEAWKALAAVYEKLARPDDELAALQICSSADPLDAKVNTRIGVIMLQKGNAGGAIEKLEAAENVASTDPALLKALAQGYAATGKLDTAVALLRRAKASAPKDLAIRERLIELLRKTGPTDSLLGEYKMMLDVKRDTLTLTTYAGLLFKYGKPAEAKNALEDLRSTRPDYVPGLLLLCRVLRAQQNYADAIEVYKEISTIAPLCLDALFERAETHLEGGQPYWAELFYVRTLKANPRHARAELGLARVAKLRRNFSAYTLHVNRARALAPKDPAIEQEYTIAKKGAW